MGVAAGVGWRRREAQVPPRRNKRARTTEIGGMQGGGWRAALEVPAPSLKEHMQGVWGPAHMEHMQGVRGGGPLTTPSPKEPMQRLRRGSIFEDLNLMSSRVRWQDKEVMEAKPDCGAIQKE